MTHSSDIAANCRPDRGRPATAGHRESVNTQRNQDLVSPHSCTSCVAGDGLDPTDRGLALGAIRLVAKMTNKRRSIAQQVPERLGRERRPREWARTAAPVSHRFVRSRRCVVSLASPDCSCQAESCQVETGRFAGAVGSLTDRGSFPNTFGASIAHADQPVLARDQAAARTGGKA